MEDETIKIKVELKGVEEVQRKADELAKTLEKAKALADELALVEIGISEGMTIKNAIDEALGKGRMLTRLTWEQNLYVIPTSTSNGMILHNPLENKLEKKLCPGWQPNADDLRATDWIVRGGND